MNRVAFVIPWYGVDIPGGSEAACRDIVERMVSRGMDVEVLTTCVKQFNSDWSVNHYKPGIEVVNGVKVRRFSVGKRNTKKFDMINAKLMNGEKITIDEEKIFLDEMVNSPDLENYLRDSKNEYAGFVFIPYMFGTTYHGIREVYDKAVLIPAFHDESYAYFESFKQMYSKVKGIIFFSSAEAEWANANYPLEKVQQKVLGLGVSEFSSYPEHFREKYNIYKPFILYAGRKDHGKNVHVLLNYLSHYKEVNGEPIDLVLIGGGSIDIPDNISGHVHDLGFVPQQDKYDAFGAAQLLCNPSPNESFSIVIMESWLSGRPVLVYEGCKVTTNFCIESNGGLYFSNYREFEACVKLLFEQSAVSDALGNNGSRFVKNKFRWDAVIDNYGEFLKKCFTGVTT
ncbi:hexosyltransferase [Paenibacillus sambharensis]|uniref:Hexosyltransferase n=1 Tax=Paenibacillus sambharensis TaxID=1803190 RepID=A0A2W1L8H6_9BACL|nr:hexosyltransferase [Paenibacillus sambharensis]